MGAAPGVTILIVDDDPAKRYSVAKILRKAGFVTREAATGIEALRLVAELPDLVILDVKLPDVSGFEVCRRIKADPSTASVPVLHLSTTFVDIEDKVQGLEGGADGYLTDVLEPLELIATVRALLRARQAEEAAQLSRRQWQVTFDAINDGVILLDGDGRVVQINGALEQLFASPWGDLHGRSFHELFELAETPGTSPFLRMIASRARETMEVTMAGRWLHVAVDPLGSPQGTLRGALCIVSDVTDRRRMEEELRHRAAALAAADRRKDEFLAMLAHELRNPLAPILNCLGLIRREAPEGRDIEPELEIAERQVLHMARLLDDLLDVSRFIQGKIRLQQSPVDVSTVVAHAVEIARPLIEAKRHRLALRLPAESVWVRGDPTRLEQAVANLLNNAAKYTEPGGEIALEVQDQGGELVMRVADTGIGLSPEMVTRVFDLFAQADMSLDRTQGGLGIGLTLVRSLIELHGGSVDARSAGPGLGSEFTVRLPTMPPPASGRPARPTVARRTEGHLRLLVVDDHIDSATSLARLLRSWGHKVGVAHDGPTAIEAVSADGYDVVLLDIGLPGMSGYEVAADVRGRPRGGNLVLIALTGYGQERDVRHSERAGFDHHLVKPVTAETLQELLANLHADQGGPRPARTRAE
ncbi:MAG TPA: response regulator [Isosphaeraceae bacterium]